MIKVLRKLESRLEKAGAYPLNILLRIGAPSDGRPYWSSARASRHNTRLAEAILLPRFGSIVRTDLWVGSDGGLVLGGFTCRNKECGCKSVEDVACPKCGHEMFKRRFAVKPGELENLNKLRAAEGGDAPFAVFGVTKKGETKPGLVAMNKSCGEDPFCGVPDEQLEAMKYIVEKLHRDILDRDDDDREQNIIIPMARDSEVLTSKAALESLGVQIIL